jgi:alkylation response protein AidB-like acyl-CoA dehydrogenase
VSIQQAVKDTDPQTRTQDALADLRKAGRLSPAWIAEATSVQGASAPPLLFQELLALGRKDLSSARLYEGHVNALQLVQRFGNQAQIARASTIAGGGGVLGVWGADAPGDPATIRGARIAGAKVFASGSDILSLAIVAAKDPDKNTQLFLMDMEEHRGRTDQSWWRAVGMRATQSGALALADIELSPEDLLGEPGQYETQPFFGAGAIRFVSAQLGGLLAVWDATRQHLVSTGRHVDPIQAGRLGSMAADIEAAYAHVSQAYAKIAPAIDWSGTGGVPKDAILADAARVVVEDAAGRCIALAGKAVGCAGWMETHQLCQAVQDLSVYLCQPAPDAARARVGIAAAEGSYRMNFDA